MDINEEFNQLQTKYLKARAESDKCLTDLYTFLKKYLLGFLKRYASKNGFYISNIEDKAEDAALFFINQYLSKPNWKVDRFTGYYGNALIKVLHGEEEQNWDKLKKEIALLHVSSDNLVTDFDEEMEKREQEQKELEKQKDDKGIKDLQHKWQQQSLF